MGCDSQFDDDSPAQRAWDARASEAEKLLNKLKKYPTCRFTLEESMFLHKFAEKHASDYDDADLKTLQEIGKKIR